MRSISFPYNHLKVLGIDKLKRFIPNFLKDKTLQNEMEATFTTEDLSPLVELIAQKMAENINSSGVIEQLEFIERNGWQKEEVIKYLLESDDE